MRAATTREFGERLGRFFEHNGLPRMAGRMLGHLLVCTPAEQRFDELVAALGASRSTVSVVTRLLEQLGLVERFGVPGDRRDRYRLRADAWTMNLKQDLRAASQLKTLADEGLALVAGQPPAARARLRAMKEFYAFLEGAYAPILQRWEKRRPS
jgi:hypothetical protein